MIKIQRCQTVPGLIKSAKTYQLVCHQQQLLVIQIGRAMGARVHDNSNPIGSAIGNKIADRIEVKYEQQIAQSLSFLSDKSWEELVQLVDNKKIMLVTMDNLKSIKLKKTPAGIPKLAVKSKAFSGTLHCRIDDTALLEEIVAAF